MRTIACVAFASLLLFASADARADEPSALLWIDNQSARRTRVDVTALQPSAGILDLCVRFDARCAVAVRPGEYRITVPSSRTIPSASRDLAVTPGDRFHVVVQPGSKLQRELGAYTIGLGALANLLGAVGYAFAFTARAESGRPVVAESILFWGGAAVLTAGIIIEETGKTRIGLVPLASRSR